MPIPTLLTLALNFPATIYGLGEQLCGDPHDPVPCDRTATTASGLPFDPDALHVAVHVPPEVTSRVRIRPGRWRICLRALDGTPTWLPISDKKGRAGLDLSPEAWRLLGYEPSPWLSATLAPCGPNWIKDTTK